MLMLCIQSDAYSKKHILGESAGHPIIFWQGRYLKASASTKYQDIFTKKILEPISHETICQELSIIYVFENVCYNMQL